jgi:rhodanese-related sulfurtransferase
MLRLSWTDAARRGQDGVARLSPAFVAELGRSVTLLDVRTRADLDGALGTLPGTRHLPLARLDEALALGEGALIVTVSGHGTRGAEAARALTERGMGWVATLDGGLAAWRAAGFSVAHGDDLPDGIPLEATGGDDGPIALECVEDHVGDPGRVRWVKMAAFLLHGRTSCVDGRDDHAVVGAPGGDMGELVLALAAAERMGVTLDDAELPGLIADWAEAFGTFYLHSDLTAANRLIAAMRADPRIPEEALPLRTDPPSAWRRFLRGPPAFVQPFILEHLIHPDHLGCGHLRFARTDPAAYGVRTELVVALLRAFFIELWRGLPELVFVPLAGTHAEQGVLLVEIDDEIHPWTRVPLVSPQVDGQQVFVHHPQVTAYQRAEIRAWLVRHPRFGPLRGDEEALARTHTALGAQQMAATLGRLAAGLPVFSARFRRGGAFVVEERGRV